MELHTAAGMPPSFAARAWLGPPCLQQGALHFRSRAHEAHVLPVWARRPWTCASMASRAWCAPPPGVDLEVELVAMVCYSERGAGHEVAVVRHGLWLCVSDGETMPVAGDLAAVSRFMEARRWAPRIGFYATRGGAAPGLKGRRRRRQR